MPNPNSKREYKTTAQKFYKMSGCKTMAEFAKKTKFHPVTIRTYLLPDDRPSWRKAPIQALHTWARELKNEGGPGIAIGLWPDGEVTLALEDSK